jgi:YHS domain-containing protein
MKLKIMVLGLAAVLLSSGYVMAEEKESINANATENVTTEEKEDVVKFCPVCGPEDEMEGLSFSYKYKGMKYSFCSMGCLKAFKKNPEQFLKSGDLAGDDDHNSK